MPWADRSVLSAVMAQSKASPRLTFATNEDFNEALLDEPLDTLFLCKKKLLEFLYLLALASLQNQQLSQHLCMA